MLHEQSAILYKNHFQTKKHSVGQLPIEQFATFTSSRQGAQMAFFFNWGDQAVGGGGGGGWACSKVKVKLKTDLHIHTYQRRRIRGRR